MASSSNYKLPFVNFQRSIKAIPPQLDLITRLRFTTTFFKDKILYGFHDYRPSGSCVNSNVEFRTRFFSTGKAFPLG